MAAGNGLDRVLRPWCNMMHIGRKHCSAHLVDLAVERVQKLTRTDMNEVMHYVVVEGIAIIRDLLLREYKLRNMNIYDNSIPAITNKQTVRTLVDKDIIVDPLLVILHNTLCNLPVQKSASKTTPQTHRGTHPNQVPYLLLLEPDKAIKHGILKLLQKRAQVDPHLVFVEFILQARPIGVPGPAGGQIVIVRVSGRESLFGGIEECFIFRNVFHGGFDGIDVLCTGEGVVPLREEPSNSGEQPRALFLCQFRAE